MVTAKVRTKVAHCLTLGTRCGKTESIVLAAGVLVSLSTSGAFAQSAAAKNVLNSCKPDIARFCSAVLPGDGRIKGCMKQHLPELSEGCKEALFQAWLRQ
jgi:Cysteine rich repeat